VVVWRRGHVDVEEQAEVIVVQPEDRPGTQQAGVGHQAVQLTVAAQRGAQQQPRGTRVGDVAGLRVHAARHVPDGVGHLFECCLVHVSGDDRGALPAQFQGVGAAQAARRAGDDDDPAGERAGKERPGKASVLGAERVGRRVTGPDPVRDGIDLPEHPGFGGIRAEHRVGAPRDQVGLVPVGQHASAKDQADAEVPAAGHELVGIGEEFPGVHRNADEVSVFLAGHRGEPLRGVEAPEVYHLIALPDEELTDRHRTDLMLVEPEGTDDDAPRALVRCHGRVPASGRRAA